MAKTDRLDAQAVALVLRRDGASLPPVTQEDDTAVLDLLVTERDGALAEATRLRNQIHHVLLQVDPDYRSRFPNLKSPNAVWKLEQFTVPEGAGALDEARAAAVRRHAQR